MGSGISPPSRSRGQGPSGGSGGAESSATEQDEEQTSIDDYADEAGITDR